MSLSTISGYFVHFQLSLLMTLKRYTNADLKVSPDVGVRVKTIP